MSVQEKNSNFYSCKQKETCTIKALDRSGIYLTKAGILGKTTETVAREKSLSNPATLNNITNPTITINSQNYETTTEIMGVNEYSDFYDLANSHIVRNIVKKEVTDNTSISSTPENNYFKLYGWYGITDETGKNILCTHIPSQYLKLRFGAFYISVGYFVEQGIISSSDDGVTQVNKFKEWCKQQKEKGTPLTVIYPTTRPTIEKITTEPLMIEVVTDIQLSNNKGAYMYAEYDVANNRNNIIEYNCINNAGDTEHRPVSPRVGYMYYDTTLNIPIFYTGTKWIGSDGGDVLVAQLSSPVMQYAMELEGVKQDYLEYSLEKLKYDKQLEKEQQAKYEAYELLLQDNPNLTWEEFEQQYGNNVMMNLSLVERLEEPQIPESVVKFMEKYL